mmetsp:Transcript_35600/g.60155  ORF Transcript_35600/g.60155 Transcript_35600/m.60155 type:complete len:326 (-) Transcript_35600:593-1570(-)
MPIKALPFRVVASILASLLFHRPSSPLKEPPRRLAGDNPRNQRRKPDGASRHVHSVSGKVVGNRTEGPNAPHLVPNAPRASVKRAVRKYLQRVVEGLGGSVGRRVWVAHVMHQQGTHHRVGRLRVHHFHGLEEVHSPVGGRKLSVVHHRRRGGGGGDVRGDGVAAGPLHHGAPVLEALGENVVRPLIHHNSVHQMAHLAALVGHRHGLDGVGWEQPRGRRCLLPQRGVGGVADGCLVRSLRVHGVAVGGGAQEGQTQVGALLAQLADDRVARQGKLHVECAVEVSVVPHGHSLLGAHRAHPRRNLGRVVQEVCAGHFSQFLVRHA